MVKSKKQEDKSMKQIYCLKEFNDNMEKQGCEMFMTMEGVAKWVKEKNPIGNKMSVTDSDIAGEYDVTVENLEMLVTECKKKHMAALFTISCNFFIQTITSKFTLSMIDVHD